MRQRLGSSVSDVVRSLDRESPLGPFARAENPDAHRDSAQHAQHIRVPLIDWVQTGRPVYSIHRLPIHVERVDQDQAINEG